MDKVPALIVNTETGEIQEGALGCMDCGHLACVCQILDEHRQPCRFRNAVTCGVPIECEHGYDVCPKCDPCTCAPGQGQGGSGDG